MPRICPRGGGGGGGDDNSWNRLMYYFMCIQLGYMAEEAECDKFDLYRGALVKMSCSCFTEGPRLAELRKKLHVKQLSFSNYCIKISYLLESN